VTPSLDQGLEALELSDGKPWVALRYSEIAHKQ